MQIVVKHILENGSAWFIHNGTNGHEYRFFVGENGTVSLQSSSPNGALHEGLIAVNMLNSLTNAFASLFSDLDCIPSLNKAMKEANKVLENKEEK